MFINKCETQNTKSRHDGSIISTNTSWFNDWTTLLESWSLLAFSLSYDFTLTPFSLPPPPIFALLPSGSQVSLLIADLLPGVRWLSACLIEHIPTLIFPGWRTSQAVFSSSLLLFLQNALTLCSLFSASHSITNQWSHREWINRKSWGKKRKNTDGFMIDDEMLMDRVHKLEFKIVWTNLNHIVILYYFFYIHAHVSDYCFERFAWSWLLMFLKCVFTSCVEIY